MKAFIGAVAAMAALSVGVWFGLESLDWTTTEKYQVRDSVRLD